MKRIFKELTNEDEKFICDLDPVENHLFSTRRYVFLKLCRQIGFKVTYIQSQKYAIEIVKIVRKYGFDIRIIKEFDEELVEYMKGIKK